VAEGPFPAPRSPEGEEWISVSDLMSGLMLVFLCVAVLYLRKQEQVAREYQEVRTELAEAMRKEFDDEELRRWGAELDQSGLVVRFVDQENQFDSGKHVLNNDFEIALGEFFPQFVSVLEHEKIRKHIVEVRIEGHTSSDYNGPDGKPLGKRDAYLANMALSQQRAHSVLSFVIALPGVDTAWSTWLGPVLRANGLSSSVPILVSDGPHAGSEDHLRSKRVEFRIVTDAEDRMREIVDAVGAP
jgi:outer membrane protein OmpA-like peptidoglycan-associated protein